jgi:hypothetical protein
MNVVLTLPPDNLQKTFSCTEHKQHTCHVVVVESHEQPIPGKVLLMQWSDKLTPPAQLKSILWRPCNFTPTHSLTGPMGKPFASHLGGQQFVSLGCTHSRNGAGFLLLALSRYFGDPDVIDHWPHPRLCANNGKLH